MPAKPKPNNSSTKLRLLMFQHASVRIIGPVEESPFVPVRGRANPFETLSCASIALCENMAGVEITVGTRFYPFRADYSRGIS